MKTPHTVQDYREKIGVKSVHEYYGYKADQEAVMLSLDEYIDLVELLKTRFINPNFPQGKALAILESIRFSYRFLQTKFVDPDKAKPATIRFAKLIEFLANPSRFFLNWNRYSTQKQTLAINYIRIALR